MISPEALSVIEAAQKQPRLSVFQVRVMAVAKRFGAAAVEYASDAEIDALFRQLVAERRGEDKPQSAPSAPPTSESPPGTNYLSAPQVRRRYGGVSDMSLWRWLRNTDLGFPKPLMINSRRYWLESDLVEWERSRAGRVA